MPERKEYIFDNPFTDTVVKEPREILENCMLGNYIISYLKNLNVKTAIIEDYIDKDYLLDYQHFYCRSFKNHKRYTIRIHFFSTLLDENTFTNILKNKR